MLCQVPKTGPTGQWYQDFVSVVCGPEVPRQFVLLADGTLQFSQGLWLMRTEKGFFLPFF